MMKKYLAKILKTKTVYPFIFSMFPVLFLYSFNVGKLDFSDTFLSFDLMAILAGILYIFFKFIFWSNSKAAIMASVWILLISSFGHFQNLFFPPETINVYTYTYFFSGWLVLMVFATIFVAKIKFDFSRLTSKLNLLSLVLLFMPFVNLFMDLGVQKGEVLGTSVSQNEINFSKVNPKNKPDIYYIIFDRYASFDTLTDVYGYDNSKFYDFLNDRGFYVAKKSSANYLKTTHSLASSLNMSYLDGIVDRHADQDTDWHDLYTLLKDYSVWHFLSDAGYKFIHVGSWWEPTGTNPYADVNLNSYVVQSFNQAFYKTTIIYHLVELLAKENTIEGLWDAGNKTFLALEKISDYKEPTFTFAHVLLPHPPYVFEADGSITKLQSDSESEAYLKQLTFVNGKIEKLVDVIQKKSPDSVIVIQSDEGPHPERYVLEGPSFNWNTATDTEINQKMQVLNAFYFPNKNYDDLYQTITPVNSFRIIFNTFFDQNINLLDDRNYIYKDNYHPYQITEVTNRISR